MKTTIKLAALAYLAVTGSAARANVVVDRTFYLMGTELQVTVDAPNREAGLKASEEVFDAVDQAERRLSTWKKDTELSRVNRAKPGAELHVSELMHRDLENAFSCSEWTSSAFDPAIGPLVSAWGLRTGGRVPSPDEIASAERESKAANFALTRDGVIRKTRGARIEEGAFGKGIGLDDALEAVRGSGVSRVHLNFGGQIATTGSETVSIAHPDDRNRTVLGFKLEGGSISTSGTSEHGEHILDPRGGRPSAFTGSATAIADTGFKADCLSTALFVMGPEKGLRWLEANASRGVQGIYLISSGRTVTARASCGLKGKLKAARPGVLIEYDCGAVQ